jgi:hypothetical protein
MEFLKSAQERDASVTVEFVKAEVLEKVKFDVGEGSGFASYDSSC